MADPIMPVEVVTWMRDRDWGMHHVEWHVVRIWRLLTPEVRAWAQEQGWTPATFQEGQVTNGLAFLAMHRVMIGQLQSAFPQHASLLRGWNTPPTNPNDPLDPLPNGGNEPFSTDMTRAVTRVHQDLVSFTNDDDLGLYIQTNLRPAPTDPRRRSPDSSAGIHNYLHNRFADQNSDVDMGDPMVNIENERFWRLHGWIDARWSAYRYAKHLSVDDAAYQAALMEAEHHMGHAMPPHPHSTADTLTRKRADRGVAMATRIPAEISRSIREALLGRAAQ